jgi:hypothetical protein
MGIVFFITAGILLFDSIQRLRTSQGLLFLPSVA